jgi:hypothetical protein
MRKESSSKPARRVQGQLLPSGANPLALLSVIGVFSELLQALCDDGDAVVRVEVVTLERIVHASRLGGYPLRVEGQTERGRRAPKKRSVFFFVRVGILLFILFTVVLWAIRDLRSREARKTWDAPVDVAIVLVRLPGTTAVDDDAVVALRSRAPVLEARLADEMKKRRAGPKPFRFHVVGPFPAASAPPVPAGEGAVDVAKYSLALKSWVGEVDTRGGINSDHSDTRIYVCARKPTSTARTMVEGRSEQNGRLGLVEVELDATMVDLTLFVVAHELMHTLGATDKYDVTGRALVPDGLAEPERVPLYPQRFAEVMARNRPIAAGREEIPETLEELAVGTRTAKEIGWLK